MKALVHVKLKAGVLDPQGKAIGNALAGLGFIGIGEVRQGKLIELELEENDAARARERVEAMCRELLANPVIEDYAIEFSLNSLPGANFPPALLRVFSPVSSGGRA